MTKRPEFLHDPQTEQGFDTLDMNVPTDMYLAAAMGQADTGNLDQAEEAFGLALRYSTDPANDARILLERAKMWSANEGFGNALQYLDAAAEVLAEVDEPALFFEVWAVKAAVEVRLQLRQNEWVPGPTPPMPGYADAHNSWFESQPAAE